MRRNNKVILSVVTIILIASFFRYFGLIKRGLYDADEMRYYRDSLVAKKSIDAYFLNKSDRSVKGFISSLLPMAEAFAGKPGHTFLGVLGLYLFGMHQYSVLFISALFGVLTIILVFLIGNKFYGVRVGLFAAFLLSICSAHIFYSRSFLAHSNQAFFLVLAAYLYLNNLRWLSALGLGYAFLAHPSGLIYFLPYLFYEYHQWSIKKRRLGEIFMFGLLFLVPFIIVEAISILGREAIGSFFVAIEKSYAAQMIFNSNEAIKLGKLNNGALGPFHYLTMSWLTNGPLFTMLLILAMFFCLGYALKNRVLSNLVVCLIPTALFLYWQFISPHERLFREVLFLFPFFCLMVAIFISKMNRKIAGILIIILLGEGTYFSLQVISLAKSNYVKIERFLTENKIDRVITPSEYLGTSCDVLMPNLKAMRFYITSSMEEAKDIAKKESINYIMTMPGGEDASAGFMFRYSPIVSVFEPSSAYYPFFYESMKICGKSRPLKKKDRMDSMMVRLYDLRKEMIQ